MYDFEAKRLYINKVELEKTLGINLSEVKTKLLPTPNENYKLGIVKRLNDIQISNALKRKDDEIIRLNTKIVELENQLQAQQSAVSSQEVLPVSNLDEKYNPTERETHLLMINAMAQMLTNPHFNVHKYIRGKNINKTDMSRDIAQHITKVLNTPETKPREEETIRKRLNEALKLNEQAD
ncbi:hypothetical protein [Rodentibacter trehalosifermentans]|uniref:hypothetical protein n=1 Tax=Rodentibacter trehalosifermentans TaxID=1908263 RepID=UPI0009847763|nr:hypothetical protein [Rodentibacter trehalosifermentans]OOF53631.1 hypothetical protein BKK53_00490 [Rodentibacter trehalosifermentans]